MRIMQERGLCMANSDDVYDGEELEKGEGGKPGKPCEGSRRDLVKCLKESECVRVSIPEVCHLFGWHPSIQSMPTGKFFNRWPVIFQIAEVI